MKLKHVLASAVALLCSVATWAYTAADLTSAGWTEVTSLPTTSGELGQYFYVFYATEADLMLAQESGTGKLGDAQENQLTAVYRTPADPASDKTKVWMLQYDAANLWGIRNLSDPALVMQSRKQAAWRIQSAWERQQSEWTRFSLTYAGGSWTIKNQVAKAIQGNENLYVGPWNEKAFADNNVVAGNKEGDNVGHFKIYAMSRADYYDSSLASTFSGATKASPADVTTMVANAGFEYRDFAWTRTGTYGNQQWGNGSMESWNNNNVSVTQNIVELPNGLYKVTVDMIAGPDKALNAYLYASADNEVKANVTANASEGNYGTMNSEVAGKTLTADNISVTNGSLTLGFKDPATGDGWLCVDNFKLYYYGPTIAGNATEFTSGSAVTAGQWYYFDVTATGEYAFTTTDALSNIVYTTVGATLIEDEAGVTTNPTAVTALTKGRIYFKASANATVTIAPNAYTYIVGPATTSFNDGDYLGALATVTYTFADSESNDPAASFAILNNTATASLKKNGTEVATGVLSLSGNVLTATFSAVTLVQGASDYSVSLPADVVGYAGHASNAAVELTFKTGTLADGTYYFKRNGADYRYLTRGGNYGTEAVTDRFGIAFETAIHANGKYTMKNVDHSLVAKNNLYLNYGGSTYTDQTNAYNWTITATEGGFYLKTTDNESFITTAHQATYGYDYITSTATEGEAIVWTPMSKSEYFADLAARTDAEAAAIASAAGISASTQADLLTALAAKTAQDATGYITNPTLSTNADGWTNVQYEGARKQDAIRFNGGAEVWNYIGGAKQTISDLPEGVYKVTVKSTWRIANEADANLAGNEANVTAWIYATAGSTTDYTQLKNWYDTKPANNAAIISSTTDDYVNTVYVYVPAGEDLTIGIAQPSWCGVPWMPFAGWTLTYYTDNPVQFNKDYIAAQKGDITGLINGDFQSNDNGWTNGSHITWVKTQGWKGADSGNNYYERADNGTMSYTVANMPAGTYKVVAAARSYDGGKLKAQVAGGEYGVELTGVGNAAEEGRSEINTNGVEMPYSSLGGFTTDGSGHNWRWITATGTLAADGDLVINFTATGNSWMAIDDVHLYCTELDGTSYTRTVGDGKGTINTNNSVVTADIIMNNPNTILRSTGKVITAAGQDLNNNQYNSSRITKLVLYDGYDFTNSGDNFGLDNGATLYRNIPADTWCTLVVPFYPSNLDTKLVPSELSPEGVLSFTNAPANNMNDAPMLVKSTAGVTAITGSRNSTTGIAKGDMTYGAGATMNGTYSAMAAVPTGSYVVARKDGADNLYKVDNTVSLAPFRAYFTVAGAGVKANIITLNLDGTETAIECIDNVQTAKGNGVIYNLAGQRLSKMQKGVNIVNGKKIFVK